MPQLREASDGGGCLGLGRQREQGSITPLAVGFMTIALLLILLAAVITDIYLAHRKLYALADSAALAAAESYSSVRSARPNVNYSSTTVEQVAGNYLEAVSQGSRFTALTVTGTATDSQTVTITLSARYRPVLLSPFVPRGIEISAQADVRGALRAPD